MCADAPKCCLNTCVFPVAVGGGVGVGGDAHLLGSASSGNKCPTPCLLVLMTQQHVSKKVSLNRNTQRWSVDRNAMARDLQAPHLERLHRARRPQEVRISYVSEESEG